MRRSLWKVCISILGSAIAPIAAQAQPLDHIAGRSLPQFDAGKLPPAPDYTGPTHWASLPWIRDDGDLRPKGVTGPQQLRNPVDLFFVHGDVFRSQDRWNADTNDVWFNGSVGQTTIGNQASAFNSCCDIYAPRYRQVTEVGARGDSEESRAALDAAYSDILHAFRLFRTRVKDRPFIIAGHGQGARLAARLIAEEIDGGPLAPLMVAAYLPGHWVAQSWVDGLKNFTACTDPTNSRCILSWNSFAQGSAATAKTTKPLTEGGNTRYLCNNPVSGWRDQRVTPVSMHLGAWRHLADTPVDPVGPLRFTAQCGSDDALYVTPSGGPYAGGKDGDYRADDIHISYMNLRQDAARRVAAFRAKGG